ncbi:hypothetical protein [Tepidimicrobium xylanilyticum]|uniref:Uncharacterized protein n=1 Tax=Tepidimicrobium xylanilyticum TaxID=1123352 RepID=A0A1H2Q6G2_9FIRM|nr:hypothetical protein [Tepidimicrobium xylanilyticum]SDW02009.1 hypothetical protein SAMN05660923_00052 [Tepidimicrobium xylanilyticum]
MISLVKPNTKYKVFVIAYKNAEQRIKNIITQHSVLNIHDKDIFLRQTNYPGFGRSFDLNDRISIYLGWFKDKIMEKLDEGYTLNIVEIHKSYGNRVEQVLKSLDFIYDDDILVIDIQEV